MTINEVKAAMDAQQLYIHKRTIRGAQLATREETENLVVRIDWISDPFPDKGSVVHTIVAEGPHIGERHILNEESIAGRLTLGSNEREGDS